jgi:hypothetical protein
MSNEHYLQQIAQMRQERAQREFQQELEHIKENYAIAVQDRNEAAQQGDRAAWDQADDWCLDLEKAWQQRVPPPQHDQRLLNFVKRNSSFFERYGDRAMAAASAAHEYMLRPRNPNTIDPRYTGCGFNPNAVYSHQYFQKMKDLLELHGETFAGVKYDPGEQALTATEAAKISGLSPEHYNNCARALHRQGRMNLYKK